MAAVIRSSYGPYRFAAALITNVKKNPLKLLDEMRLSGSSGIQFCRPEIVVSARHLVAAFAAAATTTLAGTARSKRIEVEYLLRLSCQRQIQDALKVAGIRGGEDKIVAAAITTGDTDPETLLYKIVEELGGTIEPFRQVASPATLMEIYNISKELLEVVPAPDPADALELLIIEKVVSSYVG
jgi:tRNA threonylcarbamoyladenosine modification (KEOPS) complex Cgi121 subunit